MELKVENTSTSFVQNQKHLTKSDRFQVVQPSQIAQTLDKHGFDLVHLRTGKAKNPERQDHQTTIARYRSRDGFGIQGNNFDIVFRVPHLYGALTGSLGMFRQVCANGLVVGSSYEMIKIKHLGDPMSQLDKLIPQLVAQREKLVAEVKLMQNRQVSKQELAQLSQRIAKLRLGIDNNIQNVQVDDLLKVRREADQATDLFTVMNVIQENVMRYGLRYQSVTTNGNGINNIRNMLARPVGIKSRNDIETVRSIELNASIWDVATELMAA